MNNQQCKITRLSILIESQNHINNNNNKLSVVFFLYKSVINYIRSLCSTYLEGVGIDKLMRMKFIIVLISTKI